MLGANIQNVRKPGSWMNTYDFSLVEKSNYYAYRPLLIEVTYEQTGISFGYVLDFSTLVRISKSQEDIVDSQQFLQQLNIGDPQDYFSHSEGKLWVTKFGYSFKPLSQQTVELDYNESLVFLAYETIRFILNQQNYKVNTDDFRSIRQKIVDLITIMRPDGIHPRAKLQMLSLFDFDICSKYGNQYNNAIYAQNRFKQASSNFRIVFHPTIASREILNKILNFKGSQLIYGNSGIGKSCSVFLMVELFKIISDYIVFNKTEFSKIAFIQQDKSVKFSLFPKIFYVGISESQGINYYFRAISSQSPINILELTEITSIKMFQTYCSQLMYQFNNSRVIPIFVIDQINIYYSVLRRYSEQQEGPQRQQLLDKSYMIARVINTIKDKFHVVFNSSPNFEVDLPKNICYETKNKQQPPNILKQMNTTIGKINFQAYRQSYQGLVEMINTIQFEYLKLTKGQKTSKIGGTVQKWNYFKFIKQKYVLEKLYHQFERAGELTHLRIRDYFEANSALLRNEQLISDLSDPQKIINELDQFLDDIVRSSIKDTVSKYKQFLQKGTPKIMYSKYEFLYYIKEKIEIFKNMNQNLKGCQFSIKLDYRFQILYKQFPQSINKEHSFIRENVNVLEIYYSYDSFLMIIESVLQDFDILEYFFQTYIFPILNKSACGNLLDSCCTQMISKYPVEITLNGQLCQVAFIKPLKFQHFYQIKKMTQINYMQHFSQLINILGKNQVKDNQYIAAAPGLKKPNYKKDDPHSSDNSQTIDCLLMKRHQNGQCYQIKTIDFATSSLESNIRQKFLKAREFFKMLNERMGKQFKLFVFEHYFVMTANMCHYYDQQFNQKSYQYDQTCKFYSSQIDHLKIRLNQQKKNPQMESQFRKVESSFINILNKLNQKE